MYFLIVLGSLKNEILIKDLTVVFMCCIIVSSLFCYPLFFILRKDFMAFTFILMSFIFFLFRKILIPFTGLFSFFSSPERFWHLSRASVFIWSIFFNFLNFNFKILITFYVVLKITYSKLISLWERSSSELSKTSLSES